MVKRFTELGYQRVSGEYVKYEDYAELERQRDALVAENSALKNVIDPDAVITEMYRRFGERKYINREPNDEYLPSDDTQLGVEFVLELVKAIKTPATDTALREIGAKAVEDFANALRKKGDDAFFDAIANAQANAADLFAQQLRAGTG